MGNHIPVMLHEAVEGLNIKPQGIYLDLTIGRAGHSSEILKKLVTGKLIGFDQDEEAIKESKERLSKINDRFEIIHSNFRNFASYLPNRNIDYVDGILMDLGVSSPQFDEGDRGFSYKEDAPLDMRMDQRNPLTAEYIVNNYPLDKLTQVFQKYGEDKFSYSIAKNIVKQREIAPIKTTLELVEIIKRSKPMKVLKKEGHPAKQIFQALRIEVNDELNVLQETLDEAFKYLRPHGGRLVVITFHSGEDKIVKTKFKEQAVEVGNRLDGPMKTESKGYCLVNNKPIVASKKELEMNHRSISAKLRIIERKWGWHETDERQVNKDWS